MIVIVPAALAGNHGYRWLCQFRRSRETSDSLVRPRNSHEFRYKTLHWRSQWHAQPLFSVMAND